MGRWSESLSDEAKRASVIPFTESLVLMRKTHGVMPVISGDDGVVATAGR